MLGGDRRISEPSTVGIEIHRSLFLSKDQAVTWMVKRVFVVEFSKKASASYLSDQERYIKG